MFLKTVYDILIVKNPVGKVRVQRHEYLSWNIVVISDDSVQTNFFVRLGRPE